jgi:hypothetical protein
VRCSHGIEAGAYVLGALPPTDRSGYEEHLAICGSCQGQVAELAGLPGLLGRLDARTASTIGQPASEPHGAPRGLLDSVLATARADHRRRRRRTRWERGVIALAAACLALLVGTGIAGLGVPAAPRPVVAAMSPAAKDEPVNALVAYWADHKGGTEIRMTCVYANEIGQYESPVRLDLWVYPRGSGPGHSVWYWDAGPGFRDTFWAESDLRPDQIGRLEIRQGTTVLLSYRAT